MPDGYTALCHYIGSSKWGIENLERQRIKISLFDGINDEQELCAYMLDGFSGQAVNDLKRWMIDTKALLCFSPLGNQEYMWKRYGGAHRGMCFVIRVANKFLMNVEYLDEVKHGRIPDVLRQEIHDRLKRRNPSWTESKKAAKH